MALKFSHSSSSQSLLLETLMNEVALAYPLEQSPYTPTRPKNTTVTRDSSDGGPISKARTLEQPSAITQASQSATISRSSTWTEDITLGYKTSRLSSSDAFASGFLARQNTILAGGSSPSRGARELKAILGSSNAKLKTGATLPPPNTGSQLYLSKESLLRLEGGRSGARVQLDLLLEDDSCVDDGYLNGTVLLTVRKKSDQVVMLSDGKLRLVGFECIMQEKERHIFYQCTSPLSAVTNNLEDLYSSGSDVEGFKLANEGHFILPFSFPLDPSVTYGAPKGVFPSQSGAAIRYIVMVSFRIKDPISEQKSIAHFYRNMCAWPRLDLAGCLSPLPRPIQVTMSDPEGTLKLTVTLTRLQWIAGQRCYLKFSVTNKTSRAIKSFTIGLHQDIIIYRPRDDSAGTRKDSDDVRYQTSTTSKLVTETTVMTGDRSEKGYASAKGWWTGILPGEALQFNHYLVLPPDAISIPKGRLLEVDYRLRVTISTGSLLPTELSAEVPIRIVNFISFDPAPSAPNPGPAALNPQPVPMTAQAQYTSSKVSIDTIESPAGSVYSDDEDEIVQDVIFAAPFPDSEDGPHFADLYYSALESNLNQGSNSSETQPTKHTVASNHAPEMRRPSPNGTTQVGRPPSSIPGLVSSQSGAIRLDAVAPLSLLASLPVERASVGHSAADYSPSLRARSVVKAARSRTLPIPPSSSDLSAFEELQLSPRKGKHTRTRSSSGSKPSRSDNVHQMSAPMSPGAVSVKDKIRELEERVKAIENVSKAV